MVTLTGFGGLSEIGGNQFLLESDETRLWVDFGLNFERNGQYFTDYLQPRRYNLLQDLFLLDLIPIFEGLYRPDYIKRIGKTPISLAFDAAIFSHAHWDHIGHIPLLHPDLPIWCGETAKSIMTALEGTSAKVKEGFVSYVEDFAIREKKRGKGLTEDKPLPLPRKIKTFRTGDIFHVGSFRIEPIHVDHSIPGAYAFIIEGGDKRIVYTGDLRCHGPRGDMTEDFIQAAEAEEVDILLCEGTRVEETESFSEQNVKLTVDTVVSNTRGLVLANFPLRDFDRLRTFWEVAKSNDRVLAINLKQAVLLKQLEQDQISLPHLNDPNIAIYLKRKGWGYYGDSSLSKTIQMKGFSMWEKIFLENCKCHIVTDKDITCAQNEYILFCSFFDLTELCNLSPMEGSHYIRSVTEAFNDEMILDQQVEKAWLDRFNLPCTQIHAGGHANVNELENIINRINPQILVPMHTKKPEEFQKLHPNVQLLERKQGFHI